MHVLINGLQAGNRSGTGRYTIELIRALAALDAGAQVTAVWPAGMDAPFSTVSPGSTVRLNLQYHSAGAAARVLFDQFGLPRLRSRIGAGLVHYPANFGPICRADGVVVTVHDLSFMRHSEWFRADRAAYYRLAARRTARVACRLIADSQATARDIAEFLGFPSGRIDVIPLGVDTTFHPATEDACRGVREKYRLPAAFFLYVGTMEPRKNLPRLIRAWSRIAGEVSPDLVIAGRQGWKTDALQKALASSAHAARIHLPGFVAAEDLPAMLTAAQVFVWPSLLEGFGLPPLEAMACGTPVLTSSTSSLPEVAGDAALLVDPEDEDALAGGLRMLAGDEALRAGLRAKGLTRAAHFTWARTARMTIEAYRRALEA